MKILPFLAIFGMELKMKALSTSVTMMLVTSYSLEVTRQHHGCPDLTKVPDQFRLFEPRIKSGEQDHRPNGNITDRDSSGHPCVAIIGTVPIRYLAGF